MSESKTENTLLQRRGFMMALGLGGLAAAAAVVSGKPAQAAEVLQQPVEAPATRGYQATEHVKTYYRTTRI